jgi:hypothetical protein
MRGNEMVPLLRGYPLAINPDGPVSAILPAELLAEAVRTTSGRWIMPPDGDEGLRGRHRAG